MEDLKLFMVLLGCTPPKRHTEQHDVFFSIGKSLKDLVPEIINFWPEAAGKIHIDAWREVAYVDGYNISVFPKNKATKTELPETNKLFFINLGGYKQNEFEEYHYKMIAIGNDKGKAIQKAKETAFYKHVGFKDAPSHIDDKFGIDVDDIYKIEDILSEDIKENYTINISQATSESPDEIHLGYFQLHKL
jgi:hypothetical protein